MGELDYVADRVTYAVNKRGEWATLVRLAGVHGGARAELQVRAVMVFAPPTTPTGGVVQAHDQIRIGNAEIEASNWPAPIRRGDQIIVGGVTYTIQGVSTASPGGRTAIHFLQVMGKP